MDQFGIFRDDSAPVLSVNSFPKTPSLGVRGIKEKAYSTTRGLSVRKKALGDVSNTVSQKVFSAKSAEVSGKPSENSCSKIQQDLTASCEPVDKVEEDMLNLDEDDSDIYTACKFCHEDFDYDIRPESERFTEESMKHFTRFWASGSLSPMSLSGLDEDSDLDLPDVDTSCPLLMLTPVEFSPISSQIPLFDD